MTEEEMAELFESSSEEYIKFDRVENKRSARPDLHAFLLLDTLVPGNRDIIGGAEHDEIYLDIELKDLLPLLTPELIVELSRCGVRWDEEFSCFEMFV